MCLDSKKLTKDEIIELVYDSPDALFCDKKGRPQTLPIVAGKVFDTHTHLDALENMRSDVALVRAALAGVTTLVIPFDPDADKELLLDISPDVWIDKVTSSAKALLERYLELGLKPYNLSKDPHELFSRVFYIAGVHPYGAKNLMEDSHEQESLHTWLQGTKCLGIGEIGLDFGPYNELGEDIQVKAFRWQLELAEKSQVPVELHLRDAKEDTRAHDLALEILSDYMLSKVDYHCFTAGPDVSFAAAKRSYYQAFGGAISFNNSPYIREAAKELDSKLLLIETDAPYMAPKPFRGKSCEPAYAVYNVQHVASLLSDANKMDYEEAFQLPYKNACSFFSIVQ